jgi:hypothetical protein
MPQSELETELRSAAADILIASYRRYTVGAAACDFSYFRLIEKELGGDVSDDLKSIIDRTYRIVHEKGVLTLSDIVASSADAPVTIPVYRSFCTTPQVK